VPAARQESSQEFFQNHSLTDNCLLNLSNNILRICFHFFLGNFKLVFIHSQVPILFPNVSALIPIFDDPCQKTFQQFSGTNLG